MLTTARTRILCILKIGILLTLLIAVQIYAQTGKEKSPLPPRRSPVPKINGYGPYKFGMSIEQARKARPGANKTEGNCGYDKIGPARCLTESTKLFGQDATVVALFDKNTERLSIVIITFDRTEGKEKACKKVLEAIATPLVQKWGIPTREESEGVALFWESAEGGTLELGRYCIDDDFGVVVVSYKDTPGF